MFLVVLLFLELISGPSPKIESNSEMSFQRFTMLDGILSHSSYVRPGGPLICCMPKCSCRCTKIMILFEDVVSAHTTEYVLLTVKTGIYDAVNFWTSLAGKKGFLSICNLAVAIAL